MSLTNYNKGLTRCYSACSILLEKFTPCNDADLNDILHQGEKLYYCTEVILQNVLIMPLMLCVFQINYQSTSITCFKAIFFQDSIQNIHSQESKIFPSSLIMRWKMMQRFTFLVIFQNLPQIEQLVYNITFLFLYQSEDTSD